MNNKNKIFSLKILRSLDSSDLLQNEKPFGIRVGWSINESKLSLGIINIRFYFIIDCSQIGDEYLSYGYEETGKFWTKNEFEWYGEKYSIGDIITCYAVNDFLLNIKFK